MRTTSANSNVSRGDWQVLVSLIAFLIANVGCPITAPASVSRDRHTPQPESTAPSGESAAPADDAEDLDKSAVPTRRSRHPRHDQSRQGTPPGQQTPLIGFVVSVQPGVCVLAVEIRPAISLMALAQYPTLFLPAAALAPETPPPRISDS